MNLQSFGFLSREVGTLFSRALQRENKLRLQVGGTVGVHGLHTDCHSQHLSFLK